MRAPPPETADRARPQPAAPRRRSAERSGDVAIAFGASGKGGTHCRRGAKWLARGTPNHTTGVGGCFLLHQQRKRFRPLMLSLRVLSRLHRRVGGTKEEDGRSNLNDTPD